MDKAFKSDSQDLGVAIRIIGGSLETIHVGDTLFYRTRHMEALGRWIGNLGRVLHVDERGVRAGRLVRLFTDYEKNPPEESYSEAQLYDTGEGPPSLVVGEPTIRGLLHQESYSDAMIDGLFGYVRGDRHDLPR